jgi:hypothetical protein
VLELSVAARYWAMRPSILYGLDGNSHMLTPFDLVCSKRLRIYDMAEKAIEMEVMAAALRISSLTKVLK